MANLNKKLPMTKTTTMHYIKLVYRSLLLICALSLYLVYLITKKGNVLYDPQRYNFWGFKGYNPIISGFIWGVFVFEMVLRFFPSKLESPGSQKHFKRNYIPYKKPQEPVEKMRDGWGVFWGTVAWVALNVAIITIYVILRSLIPDMGAEMMLIIALAYSVCDMICILFFCPFQSWFMKNRCCTACRIYNWDFAMMFTPFFAVWSIYTTSLLVISLALLLEWEIIARLHPERFDENKNLRLSCGMCTEKLCHHKRQLQMFLAKNSEYMLLKGNLIINKTIEELKRKRELHEKHIKGNHKNNAEIENCENSLECEIATTKADDETPFAEMEKTADKIVG